MAMYVVFTLIVCVAVTVGGSTRSQPNFIIIFADDVGYGDLSVYGHPTQEWGAIDDMAREGVRFTHWYTAETICTPSRAALLTGRYAFRSGVYSRHVARVFLPFHDNGLPRSEVTLAEALRDAGYATGFVGKWHLGINECHHDDGLHLPVHHGFQYVGTNLPFTNTWFCDTSGVHIPRPWNSACALYYNTTIIQQPLRLETLADAIVRDATAFIHNNTHNPFLLYLPLHQAHVDLRTNKHFQNSRRGVFGNAMNEMSWMVGEVLDTVRDTGLAEDTLVVFLSDHGPQLDLCVEGGDPGPFRGSKGSLWEGALRIPAIAWWPGTIKPGQVSHELLNTMDLFPTLINLAGGRIPTDRAIDGKDVLGTLTGHQPSPHQYMFHYCADILFAVRYQQYKVVFKQHYISTPAEYREMCEEGQPHTAYVNSFACVGPHVVTYDTPLVFNVEIDVQEYFPLTGADVDVVLVKVEELIATHGVHQADIPRSLMYNFIMDIAPCCNPPFCYCDTTTSPYYLDMLL